ncbi:ribonuclease P protein component [Candidatus Parcubacteria bacterium]|nr:ribonuclease P protein component [Candidatus Parcubacteria bacterium]
MPLHFSLRSTPMEATSFIISVSKKVSKKAVVRNTIKRRIRAILKEFKPSLKAAKYLLIVKPGAELVKGPELKSELGTLFKL